MKEKIYRFLKQHGGTAPAVAITHSLLHMRQGSHAAAQTLLEKLLKDDPRFGHDGMGNWYINPDFESVSALEVLQGHFVIVATAPNRVPRTGLSEKAIVARIDIRERRITNAASWELRLKTAPEELRRQWEAFWVTVTPESVFVSERPATFRRIMVEWAASTGTGYNFPAIWELPLYTFAQNVLNLSKRPQRSSLCTQLGITDVADDAHPETLVRVLASLFLALLERIDSRSFTTLPELLDLGRSRPRMFDFSTTDFDSQAIRALPELPAVYMMKDRAGRVVYVGKAKNLRQRLAQYFIRQSEKPEKLEQIQAHVKSLEWQTVDTELDALILEQLLIERHQPEINVQTHIVPSPNPQSQLNCGIVILLSEVSKRVVVYIFSAKGAFRKIVCHPGRPSRKRLSRVLQELCYQADRAVAVKKREKLSSELAWRWLRENRERVNWLDPGDFASPEACLEAILQYVANPDQLQIRWIIRGK